MNDIENRKKLYKKNRNIACSPDNDDIIKQLSQITSNDDKSFESSLILKNIPMIYDMNNFSKDNNNNNLSNRNLYGISNLKNSPVKENSIITNKHFPLNQKLKYLCSLIQINNINIKKYDDLKDFNKYFSNDVLKPNQLEPINILFDIISELIFYIQREVKNNDILMKEIKIIKQKRTGQENLINELKSKIEEKEKEIEEIIAMKNDDDYYYKFDLQEKENNELKKENKELYQKIIMYTHQIKNLKSKNNLYMSQLESFNTKKNEINYSLTNNLSKGKNLINLQNLNNSYDNSHGNLKNKNNTNEKSNFNIRLTKQKERNIKYINLYQNFSPLKTVNNERISKFNIINYNLENNDNNKNIKDGSIISNLKLLLKEINDMLNIYNSHLEKININNNENEDNNVKYINDFVNAMNDKMNKLKNFAEINKDKDNVVFKKSIQVNTSRWKFRKKSANKTQFKKIKENLNLDVKRKNTSTSLQKNLVFNKLLN